MSEFGMSLTIVGIVATVISLLFAAASLYVSHHQRHGAAHGAAHAGKAEPAKAHSPRITIAPPPSTDNMSAMTANASATPFFRKLGVHGLEETGSHERPADSAYIWE